MALLDSLLIPGSPRRPVLLDITPRIIAAPAGITNITDTFVRGAYGTLDGSATSDAKTTWDLSDGPIVTASPGLARLTTADTEGSAIITDDLASSNMSATITTTLQTGTGYGEWSAWICYDDPDNLIAGGVYYSGSEWEMYLAKFIGGSFSLIGAPVGIGSSTPAAGTTFTVSRNGTSVSIVWSGGAETISETDGTLPSGLKAGIYTYFYEGTAPSLTNFEVSTL